MIVEELAAKLVEIQAEEPVKVLLVLGIVTAMIVPGMMQIQIKPSTEAILPEDDSAVESLDTLRAKFGGDTTYIVIHGEHDLRTHKTMKKLERIENRVLRSQNVFSTTSPASMLERRYGRIPQDPQKLKSFDYGPLMDDDYRTAIISVGADTQAKSDEIRNLYNNIKLAVESEMPGTSYYLTGYNMINLATFQVIISDFIRITIVAFAAVLTVLYAVFSDLKRMLLPMTPVILALVWMLGFGGYLGADLTIISMVSAAMIMGLGIDFGIHVTKKYYSTKRGAEGMSETMTELSRGLLGGSTTTGVGFLALLAANLTGMHALGIFLFTGIISAYIGATFLLPTVILLVDGTEPIA